MSTINERFRKIREELGQTQEDFAQKASRTRSEIKNIEYGKTTPKPEVIKAICAAWGICEEWLLTGNGPKHQTLSRQEEISKFVDDAMKDASKTDTQRLLMALMDATPEEIAAIAKFARRIAEQVPGMRYSAESSIEKGELETNLPTFSERSHQPLLFSSPVTVPGSDGPVKHSFPESPEKGTP